MIKVLNTVLQILVVPVLISIWVSASAVLIFYGIMFLFTPLSFYANTLTTTSAIVAFIFGVASLICGSFILRKQLP